MKTLPIRVRLMVWYCIVFSVAGLLLSTASWLLLRQSLRSSATHELEERTDDVERFLNTLGPGRTTEQVRETLRQEYALQDQGKYLQILNDRGEWLYYSDRRSISLPLPPLPFSAASSARLASLLRPFDMSLHPLQSLSSPIQVQGSVYWMSTALSIEQPQHILHTFLRILVLLTPALLLMAALTGHLLSRTALQPVAALSEEARHINDRNLARRLPVLDTNDELSDLSQTLNQMLERIEVAFRSVRSFTANASHELRTPIALIRTRVEIALCFPRSADQYRATLVEVQAATEHMTALLDSMLTLARTDAGAEQVALEPLDLTTLVEEAGYEWNDVAAQLGLRLGTESAARPVYVLGDTTALRRLIRILIDNACRYTPSGGAVSIRLEIAQGDAVLTVSDTGIGIAAEDLPHIFERFYRAGTQTNPLANAPRRAGSGLGLSLARWIADQHRASLTVESTPAVGSTFRLRIAQDPDPFHFSEPSSALIGSTAGPRKEPGGSTA